MRSRTLIGALVLPLHACDFGQQCTLNIVPGISVTITDSVSGEPRAADAVAVARDGEFVDTLRPGTSRNGELLTRQGADERAGFYEVIVRTPGYLDWVRSGVIVRPGDCHVRSVDLEARVQVDAP